MATKSRAATRGSAQRPEPEPVELEEGEREEGERGPAGWLIPFLESRYTRMEHRERLTEAEEETQESELAERQRVMLEERLADRDGGPVLGAGTGFDSTLEPGRADDALAPMPVT